ncbi:glycosyltransferase [Photobacterium carnosum]|uniref:glycosyltransferase family 2 protein n=1 Tax=Photobacterium carnosum TaxID=2023717 RepID=UPI001E3E630F|nr:glycosyltransferase family A protein [Photobacterium carnosum]MCD9544467.1 glycosyltransferase [Photobacterium carnosum]
MVKIKYSLILATLNPDINLLKRFLDSILIQTEKCFELIIVDQTKPRIDDNLFEVYKNQLEIKFTTSPKGLSRARNVGVKIAIGEYLLFPDDDCWYDKSFISRLNKKIGSLDILTFRAANHNNINIARFDRNKGSCDKYNIWKRVSSISLCVKRSIYIELGGFDEKLGLGSGTLTSAGEDIEFPLRAMENNILVIYDPDLVSRHDIPIERDSKLVIERAKTHMYSVGYLYKKYKYSYIFVSYSLLKNIVGFGLYILKFNPVMIKYHYYTFFGKVKGFFSHN